MSEFQLGRKFFEFVRVGVGRSRVLIVERWGSFQSSLSLLGFEVRWLGTQLHKVSHGKMGSGFMGSLRG